jgi:hypothetical protein
MQQIVPQCEAVCLTVRFRLAVKCFPKPNDPQNKLKDASNFVECSVKIETLREIKKQVEVNKNQGIRQKTNLGINFFSLCYQTATRFVQFFETIPFVDSLSFRP